MDLDAVAAAAGVDAGGVDAALLGRFLGSVVDVAATSGRLSRVDLQQCTDSGAAGALAGVPLRALVDLYLSACWRLWEELPAAATRDAGAVHAAGLAVLRAADDGVAALTEGYQLARGDLSRRQLAARRAVFDALLAGGAQATAVIGRAHDLGLDLTSPLAVLVARHDATFDDPATAAVPSRLERALQGRHGDSQPLVDVRNGHLVCVFAAPDAASVRLVGDRLARVIDGPGSRARANDDAPSPPIRRPSWQAAVGPTLAGARSIRVSYEQALEALDLAVRLGLDRSFVDPADLVVYRVLLRDRAAVNDLIRTMLGPLTVARGGAGPLLETLDAYYATGGVATETAQRLHLSVRAVTYRMARVRQLTGQDPTDPRHRFAMQAAVLGARLLRWPDVPLSAE